MRVCGFASAVTFARSIRPILRRVAVPLWTLAAAAIAASCAAPGGPRSDDLVCNSAQQCRVTVRVDCNPGCTASVDHPRVLARGNDIVWTVANKPGQSYAFRTQDGVAFKTEAGRKVRYEIVPELLETLIDVGQVLLLGTALQDLAAPRRLDAVHREQSGRYGRPIEGRQTELGCLLGPQNRDFI